MKTNKKFKVQIVSMYLYTPGMPFQWMTALSPPWRGGSGSALKRWAGDVKVWKGERRGVYVYTTHLIDHFHFGPLAPAHSRALPVWTLAVNSLRVNNNWVTALLAALSCPSLLHDILQRKVQLSQAVITRLPSLIPASHVSTTRLILRLTLEAETWLFYPSLSASRRVLEC